jgi:hypothetical protein
LAIVAVAIYCARPAARNGCRPDVAKDLCRSLDLSPLLSPSSHGHGSSCLSCCDARSICSQSHRIPGISSHLLPPQGPGSVASCPPRSRHPSRRRS